MFANAKMALCCTGGAFKIVPANCVTLLKDLLSFGQASGTNEADEDGGADAEEECAAEFKPLVELQEVETVSGEEEENLLSEL
jgi:hypothetical protein